MQRVRVAGIIFRENGIALMHRKEVKKRPELTEYYTFPGGGVEETDQSYEQAVVREIEEELGIQVKVRKKLYELHSEKFEQLELFYLCEYVSGNFGTGEGPEFSHDPKYQDSGIYIPEIIPIKMISEVSLMPPEIKNKLVQDIQNNIF